MNESVKIGAAYVRVSTDSQLDLSPDSQLKAIHEYAKREGYIIPDEYVYREAEGISGKSADKRPQFRLMIATAKQDNPPFDSIFVWKFSRFARNQEEAIMYKNLLKKRGIAVRSITEPSDNSPFSSLIERIIEWMDEYYLINLASEVRRGKTEKATRGEYSGMPPYGYDLVNKNLVPNADADAVRFIFSRYVAGDALRDIAVKVDALGFKTRKGNRPDVRFVEYIVRNYAYAGKVRYSTEGQGNYLYNKDNIHGDSVVIIDGHHEPIIDAETWELAQNRLKKRDAEMKYVRREHPEGFMLKGLVRCSSCGSTLVPNYGKTLSLQCHNYNKGRCHVSHGISIAKANAAVIDGLEECIGTASYTFAPKPVKNRPTITCDWDKLIQSEESKLSRAKLAYLDGVFDTKEYKVIKEEVEENISRLREGQAQEAQSNADPAPEQMEKKTIEVMKIIKSPDVSERAKNEALRSIIEKIVFNRAENTFDIYFAP